MTPKIVRGTPRPPLFQRAAAAICPAVERQWVHAMFAELAVIDGTGRRTSWMLGSAAIVLAAIGARARSMLSFRMRLALVVALSAAMVCGVLSYADYSAAGVDDDLLAALSMAAAAALVGLAALTVRKIFRSPEFARGEGR